MANGRTREQVSPVSGQRASDEPADANVLLMSAPSRDPSRLDSAQLEAEIAAARARIVGRTARPGDLDYLRALEEERLRRVGLGQAWLGQRTRPPGPLYQLVPAGNRVAVVELDPSLATDPWLTAGTVVLTADQLEGQLRKRGIATVDEAALAGMRGSRVYLPGFESRLPGLFAQPVSGVQHLRTGFSGGLGEFSAEMGWSRGLFAADLNAVPWGPQRQIGNFPIFDLLSFFGIPQVKTSTQFGQAGRFGVYTSGYGDITGIRRPGLFGVAAQELFPTLPPADAEQLARLQSLLAVNADDVRAFRERIGMRVQQRPGDYRPFLDALLADSPETLGSRRFTSLAQIESAHAAGTLTAADRARLLGRLASRASNRVVSHGLSTSDLINLQRARAQFGLGGASAAPEVITTQVSPEFLLAERYGGGWAGGARAAQRSAAGGGAVGGLIAVVTNTGVIIFDEREHPEWARELVTTGGLGVVSGATGAAVETVVVNQLSRAAITEGVAGGGTVIFRSGAGGGAAGGVAAPIFVVGSMLLSDEHYEGEDYFSKGTRASVAGAGSGILAAGITGAIFGSEVPILGNVVGFVIGVGAYLIIDGTIGDWVEETARDMARELEEIGEAFAWAAEKSPGSFFAPGIVTPLVFRGGYRGLLRSPLDVVREEQARRR